MLTSIFVVVLGLGLGWRIYGNRKVKAEDADPLENRFPTLWTLEAGHRCLYIDELYGVTVLAFYAWLARAADWL